MVAVQNKQLLNVLAMEIARRKMLGKEEPADVITLTSTLGVYDKERVVNDRIVLCTSAAGRGIDIPYTDAVVVIPTFDIENQLMELYQICCRLRGEVEPYEIKRVHLVVARAKYNANHDSGNVMDEIRELKKAYSLITISSKMLEAFIAPKRGKKYTVPIPGASTPSSPAYQIVEFFSMLETLMENYFREKDWLAFKELSKILVKSVYNIRMLENIGCTWPYQFKHLYVANLLVENRELINDIIAVLKKRIAERGSSKDTARVLNKLEEFQVTFQSMYGERSTGKNVGVLSFNEEVGMLYAVNSGAEQCINYNTALRDTGEISMEKMIGALRTGVPVLKGHFNRRDMGGFTIGLPLMIRSMEDCTAFAFVPTVPIGFWVAFS